MPIYNSIPWYVEAWTQVLCPVCLLSSCGYQVYSASSVLLAEPPPASVFVSLHSLLLPVSFSLPLLFCTSDIEVSCDRMTVIYIMGFSSHFVSGNFMLKHRLCPISRSLASLNIARTFWLPSPLWLFFSVPAWALHPPAVAWLQPLPSPPCPLLVATTQSWIVTARCSYSHSVVFCILPKMVPISKSSRTF